MIRGIDNSLSALNAFQKKFETAADNIANSETDGFKASRTTLAEGKNGAVTAKTEKTTTQGPVAVEFESGGTKEVEKSNVDLATEMTEMITAKAGFQANIASVKTADEMLGTLLDIKK